MAMAIGPERAVITRTRAHGEASASNGAARSVSSSRAMVKRTAPLTDGSKERLLSLVPRRGRNARVIGAAFALVFALMLGAAAFQTQLARRQLTLDSIDQRIRSGRDQYEVLRRERAELRSPGRLAEAATALGMAPASQTDFVSLDPSVIAAVQRSGAAGVDGGSQSGSVIVDEFSEYAGVKIETEVSP